MDEKINILLNNIKNHKNDADWLEIVASICLIKDLYPTKNKSSVINMIKNKRTHFKISDEFILDVWNEIEVAFL